MKTAPPYTLGKPNRVINKNFLPCPTGFITQIYFCFLIVKDGTVGEIMSL